MIIFIGEFSTYDLWHALSLLPEAQLHGLVRVREPRGRCSLFIHRIHEALSITRYESIAHPKRHYSMTGQILDSLNDFRNKPFKINDTESEMLAALLPRCKTAAF